MPITFTRADGSSTWSLGAIIAVLILAACFILWIIAKPIAASVILLFIGLLALARLT